jgi:hypothetical protein
MTIISPTWLVAATALFAPSPPQDDAAPRRGASAAREVAEALRAEAAGDADARAAHLGRAVEADPANPAARGLQGLLKVGREWLAPDAARAKVAADAELAAKLADYNGRRRALLEHEDAENRKIEALEARGKAEEAARVKRALDRRLAPEHVKLALWCESHGLGPEAEAHFTAAVHLNPHDEAAWKHLGFVRRDGRWLSREAIAAAEEEAHEQRQADRRWAALLAKWKGALRDPRRRDEAERALSEVRDPRAVPAIAHEFFVARPTDPRTGVRLLGQVDTPASTRDLATLAVWADDEDVRRRAVETLRGREPRDFAGMLVGLIRTPMTYEVRPVAGPGTRGTLVVDTPRFRLTRTYEAPPAFRLSGTFYGFAGVDAQGMPLVATGRELEALSHGRTVAGARAPMFFADASGIHTTVGPNATPLSNLQKYELDYQALEARTRQLLAAAAFKAEAAQERLAADIRDIEASNARARALNSRAAEVLAATLDAPDLGDDEDAWKSWWAEQTGYRYLPPRKVAVVQALPQPLPPSFMSCFAAGTPVRTLDGPRPIESLHVGDRVLSQDATTGALAFQPVINTYHNPADRTIEVGLDDGDTLVASRFHRFWIAGEGWRMARDLERGDEVRVLGGVARVASLEAGPVVPVYNLDVAGGRTFFVGEHPALVHDNSPPDPHLKPFDAPDGPGPAGSAEPSP